MCLCVLRCLLYITRPDFSLHSFWSKTRGLLRKNLTQTTRLGKSHWKMKVLAVGDISFKFQRYKGRPINTALIFMMIPWLQVPRTYDFNHLKSLPLSDSSSPSPSGLSLWGFLHEAHRLCLHENQDDEKGNIRKGVHCSNCLWSCWSLGLASLSCTTLVSTTLFLFSLSFWIVLTWVSLSSQEMSLGKFVCPKTNLHTK